MANYHRLAKTALILAVLVIMLGAYTRLTDAGLGCPDWPGCYGHIGGGHQLKAWTEMVHRYAAGVLGILILILAGWAVIRRRSHFRQPALVPFLLVGVLIFQAVLGMWTVTLKLLPLVVTSHLLGGMAIAGLLSWLTFATRPLPGVHLPGLTVGVVIGLLILILQLFLGAWTSTNYAALACGADFPTCQGSLWPPMDWPHAFNILSPIGPDYEGGRLEMMARVTIQIAHRYWALVTFIYLGGIALLLLTLKSYRRLYGFGACLLILLCLQVLLGILNVVLLLPLSIAVAHNGAAVLLLITVVALLQQLSEKNVA